MQSWKGAQESRLLSIKSGTVSNLVWSKASNPEVSQVDSIEVGTFEFDTWCLIFLIAKRNFRR
jgi:hypothetical protein